MKTNRTFNLINLMGSYSSIKSRCATITLVCLSLSACGGGGGSSHSNPTSTRNESSSSIQSSIQSSIAITPLKSTLTTGIITVQNPTGAVVDFSITDATTKLTQLTLLPRTKMEVRVAIGDVSISGQPRDSGVPAYEQRITATKGQRSDFTFAVGQIVQPTLLQADLGTGMVDHGLFECQTGATASVQSITRADETRFTLRCEDPTTSTAHDFIAAFPASSISNDLPPDPFRSCVQQFKNFTGSRDQNYFKIKFNTYSADCQGAADKTTVNIENSFALGDASTGATGTGATGGLLGALGPLVSQFGVPTTYGQLVYEYDDISWSNNYPQAVPYAFSSDYTVQHGGEKTNVLMRYQFPSDAFPLDEYHFALQLALTNTSSGLAVDPCYQWDKPDGFFRSYDVPSTATTQIAGGLWEQKFYQFFNGDLPGATTLYLRMVPVNIDGICAGGPSNWISLNVVDGTIVLGIFEQQAIDQAKAKAAAAAAEANKVYNVTLDGYTPPVIGADDGNRHMIITKSDNDKSWPLGCGYTLPDPPPSAPWYVQAFNAVTSVWDLVSQAYSGIKNLAVDLAAGILNTLPPGGLCDNDICKGALMGGLDVGLTILGVPPNIPSSAALKDASNGYVSATLADVASEQLADGDIPPEVFKPVTDKIAEKINLAAQAPTTDKYDWATWGVPDPAFIDQPAVLWIRVTRVADATKIPTGFETISFYDNSNNSDVGQPRIYKNKKDIPIPKSIQPGQSLLIPIVLEPALVVTNDTQLVSQNIANAKFKWWNNAYKKGNGDLSLQISFNLNLNGAAGTVFGMGANGLINPAPACN